MAKLDNRGLTPVDIEDLLSWTYREEMPKADPLGLGPPRSGSLSQMIALGTRVQESRGDSLFAACIYGNPHEDAVILDELVRELDRLSAEWHVPPAELVSDLPDDVQAEAERALSGYRIQRMALVLRYAKGLGRPDWRVGPGETPERRAVRARNGQDAWFVQVTRRLKEKTVDGRTIVRSVTIEEPGRDPKTRRPRRDAYRKFEFEPPVSTVIDRRADYAQWHAALTWLAGECAGRLTAHEVTGPAAPERPWETGEDASERPRRVLASLVT
ncbi:hypothetical protein [Afifella aestuarii]|uniref:hypothetical protein n=1 Tax=Afifella aestuarii TaxID=1909496 RepID=UPI000FE2D7C2|nr:hypothetical protein [Afifella aestuarii]